MKKMISLLMLLITGCISFTANAADVLPQNGKMYQILSDNLDLNGKDKNYYLYDNGSNLAISEFFTGESSVWICEVVQPTGSDKNTYYHFKNKATSKYMAHKTVSASAFNFKINPADKNKEGCLPLYSTVVDQAGGRFMLVAKGGTGFNQATVKSPKSLGHSSDYHFIEVTDQNIAKEAFKAVLAEAKEYPLGNGIHTYTDANKSFEKALKAAKEAESQMETLETTKLNELTTNLKNGINSLTLNMPETGKFYRLKSMTTGKYAAANQTVNGDQDMSATATEKTVFFLSADGRLTTCHGMNLSGRKAKSDLGHPYTISAANDKKHYVFTPNGSNNNDGKGCLYDNSVAHKKDQGALNNWSDKNNKGCFWTLEEVKEETNQPKLVRQIEAGGFATLAAPVALHIPAGITAYTVTVDSKNHIATLNELNGSIIPRGTAVVLKNTGTAQNTNFNFSFAASTESAQTENSLNGVYVQTAVPAATVAYILGKNAQGEFGFFKMSAGDRNLAAHKAYLTMPAEAAAHVLSIVIGGNTTGIEATETEEAAEEVYFDLQGRRVWNPTKGIFVTKSGKKVIF